MAHVTDHIELYLADGMTAAERVAFEQHVAACAACAAVLAEARTADAVVADLFYPHRLTADFEDRMIHALSLPPALLTRPIVHPLVRRAGAAVAAALLLGAIGLVANRAMSEGQLPAWAMAVGGRTPGVGNAMTPAYPEPTVLLRRSQLSADDGAPAFAANRSHGARGAEIADGKLADALAKDQVAGTPAAGGSGGQPGGQAQAGREAPAPGATSGSYAWPLNPAAGKGDELEVEQATQSRVMKKQLAWKENAADNQSVDQLSRAKDDNGAITVNRSAGSAGGGGGQPGGQGQEERRASAADGNMLAMSYAVAAAPQERKGEKVEASSLPVGAGLRVKLLKENGVAGVREQLSLNTADPGVPAAPPPGAGPAVAPATEKPAALAAMGEEPAAKASDVSRVAGVVGGLPPISAAVGKPVEPALAAAAAVDDKPKLNPPADLPAEVTTKRPVADAEQKEAAQKTRTANAPALDAPPPSAPATPTAGPSPDPKAPDANINADANHAPASTPPTGDQNPNPRVGLIHPAQGRPKIIRTGDMEFEVESFETAVGVISKVVDEEGGYVSTTNSDKLPNGKVKGSIVLRVAPERLDTLVLKLRGIGDLKTQNIRAQDVTKEYTDLESRLRAAQAMCDQLLDIIKSGKASVKDLLEAEKQLGVYREKVEQLTGEINFYASQIALSTLTLTLFERDIRTPATASETETVTMTVVTEKVEDAAAKAREAVATAKGHIVASQIEQHDAGEYLATISAQVPPDAADATIARLRQIEGQVSHFDRQRTQSASNGSQPVEARLGEPLKVKREDVTINLTLFNLARLTPRRQTTVTLAAANVDDAKTSLEDQIRNAGGRVIDSRTEYPRPAEKMATLSFDVPSERADGLIAAIKAAGETLQISTVENANGQGVTESKRGFSAVILDLASVQAHRLTTLTLVAADVDAAQHLLVDQVKAIGGQIIDTKIDHPTVDKTTGSLTVNVPADKADAFLAVVRVQGEAMQVSTVDNPNSASVTDSKRGIVIALRSLTTFKARESQQAQLASSDVRTTFNDLRTLIHAQNGRVLTERLDEQDAANPIGQLEFEVSRQSAAMIDQQMEKEGQVVTRVDERSTDTENTVDSKVYVRLAIISAEQLAPRQTTDLSVEVTDVQKAMDDLRAAALSAGGRQVDVPALSQSGDGRMTGVLRLDLPLDRVSPLIDQADAMGTRRARQTSVDTHAPEGKLARARLAVTFNTPPTLTNADDSIWAGVRRGLGASLRWLSISLTLVVIGLCVVVPWVVVVWGGWRGVRWIRRGSSPSRPSGPAAAGV